MSVKKEIIGDELYLYMNGELIYKRWLRTGQSKIFDIMAYDKYTYSSIKDIECKGNAVICVKAKITMKSTKEGGRNNGFSTGYSPNHIFKTEDNKFTQSYMGTINFNDSELIYPGEIRTVIVNFLACQPIEDYLSIGKIWNIYEGSNLVGMGQILEFINLQ